MGPATHAHNFGADLRILLLTGLALLGCPGRVQDQVSRVFQLVGISCPILMTTGPVLPPASVVGGHEGVAALPCLCNWEIETSLPCSHLWGWLTHTFANRADFIMLHW